MVPTAKSRSCHPHDDVVANVSTPIFIGSCPTGKKSMYRETKGKRRIADQLPLSRRVKQKQEKSSDLLQTQRRQVKVISRRLAVPAALRTRNAATTSQPSSPLALTPCIPEHGYPLHFVSSRRQFWRFPARGGQSLVLRRYCCRSCPTQSGLGCIRRG